jgi:hypothetical protein
VDSWEFHTNEGWLEKEFWASESLVSDVDDITVGEFEWLIIDT